MQNRINTLAINLSGHGKKLTCLYCGDPFKGLLKVVAIVKNTNGLIDVSLAHKGCYYGRRT